MNHLSREERAALYEQALEMSEHTGLGVEQCMVELQHRRAALDEWHDALEALKAAVTPLVEGMLERIAAIGEAFQALSDQMGALLEQPHCPSHGCAMIGGLCPRCERAKQRRSHGFR